MPLLGGALRQLTVEVRTIRLTYIVWSSSSESGQWESSLTSTARSTGKGTRFGTRTKGDYSGSYENGPHTIPKEWSEGAPTYWPGRPHNGKSLFWRGGTKAQSALWLDFTSRSFLYSMGYSIKKKEQPQMQMKRWPKILYYLSPFSPDLASLKLTKRFLHFQWAFAFLELAAGSLSLGHSTLSFLGSSYCRRYDSRKGRT